jgi:hypothetical protein
MPDTILLRAEYDEGDAKQRVIALRKELENLRKEQTEAVRLNKQGILSNEGLSKATADIEKRTAAATIELRARNTTQKQATQADAAANLSLQQLTLGTAKLTEGYKQVNKAASNSAAIEVATSSIQKNTAATVEGKKSVADYVREQSVFGVSLGEAEGKLKNGVSALSTFTKAATTGRGALVALSAVPIILFLTLLIGFFTRTQAGADYLSQKLSGLTGVLSFLGDKVANVGESMFKAFENPKQALKDLGNLIVQNVINRFKAFAVILEAIQAGNWRGVIDGLIQVGTGVEGATGKVGKMAEELNRVRLANEAIEKENQAIRESERAINLQRAKNQAQIEELKKLSDDTTKSEAVRIKAARDATALEQSTLKQSLALQQRKVDNIKAEMKLNNVMAEDSDKLAEAETELQKLRGESATKQTELQNKLNGLNKEAADKRKEFSKEELQRQISDTEIQIREAKRRGDAAVDLEAAVIRAKADLANKDAKTARDREINNLNAEQDIADLRVAAAVAEQERFFRIRQLGISARLSLVKKGTQEEADLVKDQITNQAQQDRIAAVVAIKDAKELKAKLADIDASEKAQKLAVDASLKAKLAQNDVTAIQARLNAVRAGSADEFNLRRDLLEAQMKAELENTEITQEQIAEIKSRYAKAQKEVDNDRLVQQRSDEVASAEIALNATRAGTQAAYKAQKKVIETQRAERITAAKEDAKAIEKINSEQDKAQRNLDENRFNEVVDQSAEAANRSVSILSSIFEIQAQNAANAFNKQMEAAVESAGLNAELRTKIEEEFQEKRAELEKEGAKKRKLIAMAEAAINTAVGATKAYATQGVLGLITGSLIVAAGLAQEALINAQEFAYGGAFYESYRSGPLVKGPGGPKDDKINAKLSNGEAVMTARAVAKRYQELSEINEEGGGVRFPGAKPLGTTLKSSVSFGVPNAKNFAQSYYSGLAYGGPAAMAQPAIDINQLSRMIGVEVGAQVDAAFRRNPIPLDVRQVTTAQSNIQIRDSGSHYRPAP